MELTAKEKRESLKKMLQGPGCSIAPSCNDGIQARLVEWLGFVWLGIREYIDWVLNGMIRQSRITVREALPCRRLIPMLM